MKDVMEDGAPITMHAYSKGGKVKKKKDIAEGGCESVPKVPEMAKGGKLDLKKNHGDDCDCPKCEKKRRKEDVNDGPDVANEGYKGTMDLSKANPKAKKKVEDNIEKHFGKKVPGGKMGVKEELKMTKKEYAKIHKDFKSDDPKKPRTTKYVPGKGTVSMPVKFVDEAKYEAGASNYGKMSIRNKRAVGYGGNAAPPEERRKAHDERMKKHKMLKSFGEAVYTGPNKDERKLIKKLDNKDYAAKLADYEKNMDPKKRQALKDKATKGMTFKHEETYIKNNNQAIYGNQEEVSEEGNQSKSKTETSILRFSDFNEATRFKKEKGYDKGGTKKPTEPKQKDSALDFVKAQITKQYGKGAIMSGGSKQQKKVKGAKSTVGTGKYKKAADQKKQTAADAKKRGFKSVQNYTDTMARYGGKDNYDKGRGLGT